jgi:hypothetical protein
MFLVINYLNDYLLNIYKVYSQNWEKILSQKQVAQLNLLDGIFPCWQLHLTKRYRILSNLHLHLLLRVNFGLVLCAHLPVVLVLLVTLCLLSHSFLIWGLKDLRLIVRECGINGTTRRGHAWAWSRLFIVMLVHLEETRWGLIVEDVVQCERFWSTWGKLLLIGRRGWDWGECHKCIRASPSLDLESRAMTGWGLNSGEWGSLG